MRKVTNCHARIRRRVNGIDGLRLVVRRREERGHTSAKKRRASDGIQGTYSLRSERIVRALIDRTRRIARAEIRLESARLTKLLVHDLSMGGNEIEEVLLRALGHANGRGLACVEDGVDVDARDNVEIEERLTARETVGVVRQEELARVGTTRPDENRNDRLTDREHDEQDETNNVRARVSTCGRDRLGLELEIIIFHAVHALGYISRVNFRHDDDDFLRFPTLIFYILTIKTREFHLR